jgi:hypothetical protein
VVDSNRCEDLRRAFRLVGLNTHLITGHLLMIFLPKYRDDIERGATGEADRNHLDRFCARSPCGIVHNEAMATSGSGDELAFLPKCLGKLDFRGDHECLLQSHKKGTRINAEGQNLLQEISEGIRDVG